MRTPAGSGGRQGPKRTLGVALALGLSLALSLLASEVVARVVSWQRFGHVDARAGLAEAVRGNADAVLPETKALGVARRRVLHPFFGYGVDHAPSFGVGSKVAPVQQRRPGTLIVGITGGSVAGQVRTVLAQALRNELELRELDLEPVVVGLLVDGFKQPQQLAAVQWFLSLGAEYDVVINLDGFNDIVLPWTDNYLVGVHPFYPRSWNWMVRRRPSQAALEAVGEIAFLRRKQEELARWAGDSWLGRSALVGLVVQTRLASHGARLAALQESLAQASSGPTFEANGPFEPYPSYDALQREAADVWARSSVLLHHALRASGTAYLHVLQPNQYVPGSKPLSAQERRTAFDADHAYREPVEQGYPHLLRASNGIREAGVAFVDATQLFEEEQESVYRDDCCHFNAAGKERLARLAAQHALNVLGL